MNRYFKKILIGLGLLLVLSPLGVLLPHWLNAGGAWGEWKSDEIREHAGYVPEKLESQEKIWNAPMEGYQLDNKKKNICHTTGFYLVSAGVGIGIIALGTWGLLIYYKRHES